MELKPDHKQIDQKPSQVDDSTIDLPSESQVTEQPAVVDASVTQSTSTASKIAASHEVGGEVSPSTTQHTSLNTDLSVSSGSPMSTSSLPLSTQTSSAPTPSNAQRPGERLRQARLLKNRDLKEIAIELNISERLLTAIEADDYKSLPEPAFIRGYLRAYGRLLGIDSDVLITQFNEIYTSATGLSSNHSLENSPLQQLAKLQTRTRKSKRWMWWLLIPIALVILVLVLRPVVKKVMGSTTSESTAAQTVVLTDNAQYGSSTIGSTLPLQQSSTPLAPLTSSAAPQSAEDQLVLTLSKASDVVVQDSTGKTLISGTQGTDKPLTVTGSSPFSITLSDATAVNLSLNNEHIDLKPYTVDGHASFRLSR